MADITKIKVGSSDYNIKDAALTTAFQNTTTTINSKIDNVVFKFAGSTHTRNTSKGGYYFPVGSLAFMRIASASSLTGTKSVAFYRSAVNTILHTEGSWTLPNNGGVMVSSTDNNYVDFVSGFTLAGPLLLIKIVKG